MQPIRHRPSLRVRVALAFAGLGAVSSLLFALGIRIAAHDVSQRLIDETLDTEMTDYIARRLRNPYSLPPDTASLKGYRYHHDQPPEDLPATVTTLVPGKHEIVLAETPYRAAVIDQTDVRYLLLFDESRQQRREQRFLIWLSAGAGLMTLLAALGGWWLAGRVIAPVTELAHAVSGADPRDPPRLAHDGDPGDELDELARAFDRYLARLAAFVERERDFAADAGHELRTPLAIIRGAAEVLADVTDPTFAQQEPLARIERAAAGMNELIEGLLLLAREDALPAQPPWKVASVVTDCVERYQPLARMRDTRVVTTLDDGVFLTVPAVLFAIIVANLLRNALAHTRAGHIHIELSPTVLTITDSGTGIAPADLPRVFERHFRGPESRGAGIGLPLVRRICTRLGWEIALESPPDRGTTARLRFGSTE